MDNFRVVENTELIDGTSFHGMTVTVNPQKVINLFGRDWLTETLFVRKYKVTRMWILVHKSGAVFTVYDWKKTNWYDPSLIYYENFWDGKQVELNIGHKKEDMELARELAEKLTKLCN